MFRSSGRTEVTLSAGIKKRDWLIAAAVVFVVLAVGLLNYFFAGRGGSDVGSSRLTPTRTLALRSAPQELLHMPWGDGRGNTVDDSIEYVFHTGDRTLVVDHARGWDGSRVRWFGGQKLEGELLTPRGSTNFSPTQDGFTYVVARGIEETHQVAAVYSIERSELVTYTIPLQVNAGALLWDGDMLYAQVDNSTYDPNSSKVHIESRLVPVAKGGIQATDAQAKAGAKVGNAFGPNGDLFGRTIEGFAMERSRPTQRVEDLASGTSLQIPGSGRVVGFDESDRVYVLLSPDAVADTPPAAGVTSVDDPYSLLLIGRLDGSDQWVLPLPLPRSLQLGRALVTLGDDRIVVTKLTPQGVDIMQYEGDFR